MRQVRGRSKPLIIPWLMTGDAAIRWQVMRDLLEAPAREIATERRRPPSAGARARRRGVAWRGRVRRRIALDREGTELALRKKNKDFIDVDIA